MLLPPYYRFFPIIKKNPPSLLLLSIRRICTIKWSSAVPLGLDLNNLSPSEKMSKALTFGIQFTKSKPVFSNHFSTSPIVCFDS